MSVRHGLRGKISVATPEFHVSPEYTAGLDAHMAARNEHHGHEHARWRDLSKSAQSMPCFAILRNPWARVASRYFFGRQVAQQGKPESKNYTFRTFDEFLEERHVWGHEPFYWHRAARGWYPALDYVTDEGGEIRCDLLRCEYLAHDLYNYAGWVLPERRRNVTADTIPYRELYTPRQIQVVADWYAADIEAFDFEFDTPARRVPEWKHGRSP